MRIGLWPELTGLAIDEACREVRTAAAAGFDTVWFGEVGGWDPLTLIAATAPTSPGIGWGTAIVRTYPRHPLALAAQALTTQALTGGRLKLGIGPGHAVLVENSYGYAFESPVRNVREYLTALRPLLQGEAVDLRGRFWTVSGSVDAPGVPAPPVLLSALGPAMLRVAGELADGNVVTWAGPVTVGDVVLPAMASAAAAVGRATPEVVAGVCVCLTADADGARRWVNERYGAAWELPSYRAVFDREGVSSVGGAIVAGDQAVVEASLRRYADAGAAEVQVIPVGRDADKARTIEFLGDLARRSRQ
jgi:F420-dependent oxidoreductase-like protein